nr:MAG TPA: hypothetical protein [Caudoviricetes sp.]
MWGCTIVMKRCSTVSITVLYQQKRLSRSNRNSFTLRSSR